MKSGFLLLAPLALSCTGAPGPGPGRPADSVSGSGSQPLVLLLTVDSVNRSFLGINSPRGWDTTPYLDALFQEGTLFPNTATVRGYTAPSMASFLTGVYPRSHGLRSNDGAWADSGGVYPLLQERFQEAGYYTLVSQSNRCEFQDFGVDVADCNSDAAGTSTGDQSLDDAALVDQFLLSLDGRPAGQPVYAWVHLFDPHEAYSTRQPWYDEFHPTEYTGPIAADDYVQLGKVTVGEVPYTDVDAEYVEAVYASQVRDTDERIKTLLEGIKARGMYDEMTLVVGFDHGETVGTRRSYFEHGCSFFNEVQAVSWFVMGPGLPRGQVLDNWVSTTDFAPTMVGLAGLQWTGDVEGHSLVENIVDGAEPTAPAFFERSTETAGVYTNEPANMKYAITPLGSYDECRPYNGAEDQAWTNDPEELYDLTADPGELVNLANGIAPAARSSAREVLCGWVNSEPWLHGEGSDADSVVWLACNPGAASRPVVPG